MSIFIFVGINERLYYAWQKHCFNSTYGERVGVQVCLPRAPLLWELQRIASGGNFPIAITTKWVLSITVSLPLVTQIRVLPQRTLNWKFGMKKNPSGDKTKHMLYCVAKITYPAM